MTKREEGERERRIEAAAKALWDRAEKRAFDNTRYPVTPWEEAHDLDRTEMREEAALSLDAADEAVPVVSEAEYSAEVNDRVRVSLNVTRDAWEAMEQRAEHAEAAARDFSAALRAIRRRLEEAECGDPDPSTEWLMADAVLRAHPSFSGEEGTGT